MTSCAEQAARLLELCRARGLTIATAESCTGGLIAGALTAIPGSSDVVDRGYVVYSNRAKEEMLERTHIPEAPWWVVQAVDKKKARLNMIAHLLKQVPYEHVPKETIELPARVRNEDYIRHPVPADMYVPEIY